MSMRNIGFYGAFACITAALLAGCGGASNGSPGSIPQTAARVTRDATSKYKTLYRFLGGPADGAFPQASLVELGGKLYGTTQLGGTDLGGIVFSVTKAGVENIVYSFKKAPDAGHPLANLIVVGGVLYGTSYNGGGETRGTVFSVTTAGVEQVLYQFVNHGKDGGHPNASLIHVGGKFFGTTQLGGHYGRGTVFSLASKSNELTVLHEFGASGDGANPSAPLTKVGNTFYGTTQLGGAYAPCNYTCGTVFSVTPNGTEKVLHSFGSGSDGGGPTTGLTKLGGTLYGTTAVGGTAGKGTVFSVTTSGTEKVIYSFSGGTDGGGPGARLINVNGTLYGTTFVGGDLSCGNGVGCGTVFSITPSGKETVLYSFTGSPDGAEPAAGLIEDNGVLYGTTRTGGTKCPDRPGCGTVYALNI